MKYTHILTFTKSLLLSVRKSRNFILIVLPIPASRFHAWFRPFVYFDGYPEE